MYSTCLFCHTSLGANEAIERFPVGRRLAFDAAKGRLWVVCGACGRWNLTPLEERWEAIEQCERAFRDTKLRVSTEQIGLARLREGLTLVRIGEPQRPEMAAWRYGDQFGRRRRNYFIGAGAFAVGAAGLLIGGPITGLLSLTAVGPLIQVGGHVWSKGVQVRCSLDGTPARLNRQTLAHVELRPHPESGYEIEIPYTPGRPAPSSLIDRVLRIGVTHQTITLQGDAALAAARILLPHVNSSGGAPSTVSDAVALLEQTADVRSMFTRMAAVERPRERAWWGAEAGGSIASRPHFRLRRLSAAQRLALEMAVHEKDERQALEGELSLLEERWREAEEIAAISDDMFLPKNVLDRLRSMRED